MQKVLEQSGIRGVYIINNQISHAFRKKIPYLQEVFKKASRDGGKGVQKLLTHLELGPKRQAFQVTSTGLIPILTNLPDMRLSKCSQSRGPG